MSLLVDNLPFLIRNFDMRQIPITLSDGNVVTCTLDAKKSKLKRTSVNAIIQSADKCAKRTNCTIVVFLLYLCKSIFTML